MPKKLKLSLDQLKIQSFVTSLDDIESKKVKGGETEFGLTCNFKCGRTAYWECETDPCSYTCECDPTDYGCFTFEPTCNC